MHPSNMFNRKMPIGIGVWVGVIDNLKRVKDVAAYEIHIKHLKLKKDRCQIPLIYLRNEEGVWEAQVEIKQQVIFEVGFKWKFIMNYYEGEWKILWGIEHNSKVDLFNDYVEHFFMLKKTAKENGQELKKKESSKSLLNSLYGRFGLSPKRNYFLKNQIKKPIEGLPKFLAPKRKVYYQWVLTDEETMPSTFSYVPLAAVISAYSWVALMKAVIQDRVVYWDTDSVAVLGEFILPLGEKIGTELGDWELKSIQQDYQCDASKWYSYLDQKGERVWKTKGLTKKSQPLLLSSQIDKVPFLQAVRTANGVQFQRREFELPRPEKNSKRQYNWKTKQWEATARVFAPASNYLDF